MHQAGSPTPELSTPSSSTTPQAIRLLYGHSIAKELLHETVSSSPRPMRNPRKDDADKDQDDDGESWVAEAYFTNANYQAKKIVFLLFINRVWGVVNVLCG
jgi:DNA mismatch repair protein MLH1